MIILGLADIHGDLDSLKHIAGPVSRADLVILAGDITNFRGSDAAAKVVDMVAKSGKRVLAVSGNCDLCEVDGFLERRGINLHARAEMLDGIGIIGLGGSLITPFNTPNEYTEVQLEAFLISGLKALPPDTPFILISHQPPINTACDMIGGGIHVGSHAVRNFIERQKPLVCLTGHIHESAGKDRIINTEIINPGRLSAGGYAWIEISGLNVVVEIRS
ncbi:MAG: hypothetical protein GXP53_05355 [Deltaproteobacteria bacterium]|nr:hypothetical protein [Deltaproteobacteria bacterium]